MVFFDIMFLLQNILYTSMCEHCSNKINGLLKMNFLQISHLKEKLILIMH